MIPPLIATGLIIILFALIFYTFADLENPIYANIMTCGFAWLLAFALALMFLNGSIVVPQDPVILNQTVNATSGITTFAYSEQSYAVYDAGVAYFLAIIGLIMLLVNIYLAYEIYYVSGGAE